MEKEIYCNIGYRRFFGLTIKIDKKANSIEHDLCEDFLARHQNELIKFKYGLRSVKFITDGKRILDVQVIDWHEGKYKTFIY